MRLTTIALLACTVALAMRAEALASTGLDGCLYTLDGLACGWSEAQWQQEVEAMRAAGFRHVIVAGVADAVRHGPTTAATSAPSHANAPPPAALTACDRLMRQAQTGGLRVYLSVWSHPLWYGRWDLGEEIETNRTVIDRLAQRYAASPAFAGWYIPHEIYLMWDEQARYVNDLYRQLSALCKRATPGKPVILSPFFVLDRDSWLGDFRHATPQEYEDFWAALLAQTQIDIIALQDSGEHLSFYTLDDRRPFLAAMKNACRRAGKTLWVNIETGELHVESFEDYARRFGRKTHVNDPSTRAAWRAVPPDRLRAKVRLAREYADTTITWGYREYWDPLRGAEPQARFHAYLLSSTSRPAP